MVFIWLKYLSIISIFLFRFRSAHLLTLPSFPYPIYYFFSSFSLFLTEFFSHQLFLAHKHISYLFVDNSLFRFICFRFGYIRFTYIISSVTYFLVSLFLSTFLSLVEFLFIFSYLFQLLFYLFFIHYLSPVFIVYHTCFHFSFPDDVPSFPSFFPISFFIFKITFPYILPYFFIFHRIYLSFPNYISSVFPLFSKHSNFLSIVSNMSFCHYSCLSCLIHLLFFF